MGVTEGIRVQHQGCRYIFSISSSPSSILHLHLNPQQDLYSSCSTSILEISCIYLSSILFSSLAQRVREIFRLCSPFTSPRNADPVVHIAVPEHHGLTVDTRPIHSWPRTSRPDHTRPDTSGGGISRAIVTGTSTTRPINQRATTTTAQASTARTQASNDRIPERRHKVLQLWGTTERSKPTLYRRLRPLQTP